MIAPESWPRCETCGGRFRPGPNKRHCCSAHRKEARRAERIPGGVERLRAKYDRARSCAYWLCGNPLTEHRSSLKWTPATERLPVITASRVDASYCSDRCRTAAQAQVDGRAA